MEEQKKTMKKFHSVYFDNLGRTKEYLEKMASNGWMLVDYTGYRMKFEECTPCKLNFAVEVFDKASMYSTFCNENNLEYIEYCEKAGWKYICTMGNLQFFYSEDLNLTPIETDDELKLKCLWKAMKPQLLSVSLVLPLCGLAQLLIRLMSPLDTLSSCTMTSLVFIWLAIIVNGCVSLTKAFAWKNKCKKSIKAGNGIIYAKKWSTKKSYGFLFGFLVLWSALGCYSYVTFDDYAGLVIFLASVGVLGWLVLLNGLRVIAVERKMSPSAYLVFQIIISCVVMFSLCGVVSGIVIRRAVGLNDTVNLPSGNHEIHVNVDDINYFFAKDIVDGEYAVLVEQPESKEDRVESGYSAESFEHSKFILEYSEGEQIPFDENRKYEDEMIAIEHGVDEVMMSYQKYYSKCPQIISYILTKGKKGSFLLHGLQYDFENATVENMNFDGTDCAVYLSKMDYNINDDEEDISIEEMDESGTMTKYYYLFVTKRGIAYIDINKNLSEETMKKICETLR